MADFEREMVAILFRDAEQLPIKPNMSDANPQLKEVGSRLFERIKTDSQHYCQPRRSSLVAWILAFALIFEIPWYNALHRNQPAMLVMALFCAVTFAVPFYVFSRQLPSLFSGSVGSFILLGASVIFALFVPFFVYSGRSGFFFATALYPCLATALAISIYRLPWTLRDDRLLSRIIGYKKYLDRKGCPSGDDELKWAIGLEVHTDVTTRGWDYEGFAPPPWLHCSEDDARSVIKRLFQTFNHSVNRALNGEMKTSRGHNTGGRVMDRC